MMLRTIAVITALVCTSLVETSLATPVKPKDWVKYYSLQPQSNNFTKYVESFFTCEGEYALCAYATCVKVEGSVPPVAECGCYSYTSKTINIGAIVGVLDRKIKKTMKEKCKKRKGSPTCKLFGVNKTPFCKSMNKETMYKGAKPDYISTWNPTDWDKTVGYLPASYECPDGGTYTNCFSAACYKGAPKSPFLQGIGSPKFNATCYCPYYTRSDTSVLVWNATADPCGPTNKKDVKKDTLIYNGM